MEKQGFEPQPSPLEGLYHRFFNRPPDPQGLKSYQEALQKGQTLTEVAWIFGHSEEYQKRVQKHTSNPQAAVNLLFRSLLNREPDPSGNTYYQERLKRGDGVVEITEQIQTSEEYRTKAIQQLYQELLRRAADPSGLADKLGSGLSIPEIASKIRRSEEYRSQTGRGADKTQEPSHDIDKKIEIGAHGAIITELVRNGVVIDGVPLRRGDDESRIVSPKSSEQYATGFRQLFQNPLENRPILALEPARRQRRQLLRLLGLSYLRNNPNTFSRLENSLNAQGQPPIDGPSLTGALEYFQYLVEEQVGNTINSTEAVRFPQVNQYQDIIRRALTTISPEIASDQDHGLQEHIINSLPQGKTTNPKDRDTLQLGLLLRQLYDDPKAQQEHKIQDLATRFF
jgi:hypothetical protein